MQIQYMHLIFFFNHIRHKLYPCFVTCPFHSLHYNYPLGRLGCLLRYISQPALQSGVGVIARHQFQTLPIQTCCIHSSTDLFLCLQPACKSQDNSVMQIRYQRWQSLHQSCPWKTEWCRASPPWFWTFHVRKNYYWVKPLTFWDLSLRVASVTLTNISDLQAELKSPLFYLPLLLQAKVMPPSF